MKRMAERDGRFRVSSHRSRGEKEIAACEEVRDGRRERDEKKKERERREEKKQSEKKIARRITDC